MKVELRCQSCGAAFLVQEGGREDVPCPACGTALHTHGAAATTTRARPSPHPTGQVIAPTAESSPARAPARSRPASSAAIKPEPEEVVCPRCGLHFSPRGPKAVRPVAGDRRTVLVVEDMSYFVEIAREALATRFNVKTARSLAEARSALMGGGVDLILLDLTLEGGEDGRDLLRGLPHKPCPVLIYTAEDESVMYGEPWMLLQGLGADDLVIKGMNAGEAILRKAASLLGEPVDGR